MADQERGRHAPYRGGALNAGDLVRHVGRPRAQARVGEKQAVEDAEQAASHGGAAVDEILHERITHHCPAACPAPGARGGPRRHPPGAWPGGHPQRRGLASGDSLQQGDVLCFYTQRIHRAPPPPPAGSPRYMLFGAFCQEAHRGRAGAGRHMDMEGEVGRAPTLSTY